MGGSRWAFRLSAFVLVVLLASCGHRDVVVPRSAPIGLVSFDRDASVAANGVLPKVAVKPACGSDTATFGSELIDVPPNKAKVNFEWGAIAEDTRGEVLNEQRIGGTAGVGDVVWAGIKEPKFMLLSGTVDNFTLSTGDLTFNHPWGLDMTMDVRPDPQDRGLALKLGSGDDADGPEAGTVHIEIQQGLVPHSGPGLQDFMSGFEPANGDRIAAYGPWIIDCGHDDWHSELHELAFLAFGHAEGNTAVVHTYYNPYRQSQYLSPDPAIVNQLLDYSRWSDPSVKPFAGYLVGELLRVGHLAEPFHDRIIAHHMLKANYESPAPWWVCAPGTGTTLDYSYSFTVRSGVRVSATPDADLGCVRVATTIAQAYSPEPPNRKDCVNKWSDLNQQLQAALSNPDIDVRKLIEDQVPKSFIPSVERDPIVDCYDPLQVPALAGGTRTITRDDTQPYPFYGEVKVSWSK